MTFKFFLKTRLRVKYYCIAYAVNCIKNARSALVCYRRIYTYKIMLQYLGQRCYGLECNKFYTFFGPNQTRFGREICIYHHLSTLVSKLIKKVIEITYYLLLKNVLYLFIVVLDRYTFLLCSVLL